MSSLAFAPAANTRGAQSFVVFSSSPRRRVKRSSNAAAVFRDGLSVESTSSRRRSTKTKASSESSSEMRLSAAERKQLEEQRKLFEAELARRERAKQRKSDEPDYKAMFREEEKKLNESLMSGESESVNEADVEFRRRQLMLMKVEKELKPMARGYGVSPSGTKAKLVEKILEHEMKTLAMTSDFNEQDVVDGASSWRKARSVDEKVAKEKEGENWAQTERSRMLKDTYGFGRGNIDDDDDNLNNNYHNENKNTNHKQKQPQQRQQNGAQQRQPPHQQHTRHRQQHLQQWHTNRRRRNSYMNN